MDEVLLQTRKWSPVLLLLFYSGIPPAFFICSLDFIAPERPVHWCIDDFGVRHHNGSDQCHFTSADRIEHSCISWEFDDPHTFTSEFSAICDRRWLRAWAQSALMVGIMFGNLIFSHVSDWYGRKTTCLLSSLCILGGGVACSLAPTFPVWICLRMLAAFGLGGNQNGPITLSLESTNPRDRALLALGANFGWVIGMTMVPILPLFIHDWRYLQFAISLSAVPTLVLVAIVDESPRWLIAMRRVKLAKKVLSRILERNQMLKYAEEIEAIVSKSIGVQQRTSAEPRVTLANLFEVRTLAVTTSTVLVLFPLNVFVYYNLLYSILALDTDGLFANQQWAGILEIPTLILVFLSVKFCNRKTLHFITNVVAATCCTILFVSPVFGSVTQLLLASLAKTGVQVGSSVLAIHINEIYPTRMRGLALGTCVTASRIGSILSPFSHEQKSIDGNILNSLACFLALALSTRLKETFGKPLPDDIDVVEDDEGAYLN